MATTVGVEGSPATWFPSPIVDGRKDCRSHHCSSATRSGCGAASGGKSARAARLHATDWSEVGVARCGEHAVAAEKAARITSGEPAAKIVFAT